ncbi:Krr1 family protein [Acanthamoeba castellanii str. Neff]|uniref:Krr1 family protein n=1 Tax=Acanthamoeba castellanii (strain ATCC 30010 / Neff) TaxID=1257118 RepID=L8HLH0_ACACF|nr:Krr1 family protein [Acanthamoeba castellanii str. Neff]ELR25246.1 Krr1 family protein [Acanthamoeba castellanii str. Neff]
MKHQEAVAFHYLEEGSDQIISHPRVIEDSARRKDSKRAKKREKRKEKKALERTQKEEELKRIKNLMKESIKKQLSKIQETSGASDLGFAEEYLEDEFDPTEHDRKMASTFDDDYYEGEGDEEMPVFNEDPDESEKNFGLQNTVGSLIGNKRADEEVYDEEEYYGGGGEEEAGQAQPDAEAESKRKMDELLEKYYALDFEDLIAGEIPCRFKYRQVKPKSYGMDVDTILTLPDAELNKRVSLKKLAPYRHFNLNAKKRAKRREKQLGGGGGDGGGGHSRAANRWSSSSSSSSSSKKREWNGDGEQQQQQSSKKRKFEEKSEESGDKKKGKKQKKEGGSKIEKSAEDKKEKEKKKEKKEKKEKKAKKQSRGE